VAETAQLDAIAFRVTRHAKAKVTMIHSAVINVMIKAAHRAGRGLKRDLGEVEHLQVSLKGPRNFVTAADRRAEEIVREELLKARPDYGFLGEEGGARPGADTSHRWIVDPLDGTTNFLHGIPHFAVSIALERNGAIVAALTFNPANDELFVAERGKGAFLNDRRMRVAARKRLAEAVVACGLPHFGRGDLTLARYEIAAAQQHFAGLRRYGAATLDLAWIAAGRLDAYWERDLSPWDLAAGMLLVREAGGFVTDLDGGEGVLTKGQVAAGNDTMHRELLRLLKEAGKEAEKEAEKEAAKAGKLAETP
jgi:myo-inositol-1(or 4)-monophosphatase